MKTITLALQGGGTHGAFTWGVLDRLLEDGRLGVEAISATSAGAMNAAMVVDGHARAGRQGAREQLARLWREVAASGAYAMVRPTWLDRVVSGWGMAFSPAYQVVETALRLWSPYQLNPCNLNPLENLIERLVDFERLRDGDIGLFVSATNVLTGKLRIFGKAEIDARVLVASAALPHVFQAVTIDGQPYWDGGYMANPAIYPLLRHTHSGDVVIVQVNPIGATEVPTTALGILDRINEISFNSSIMREMHAIAWLSRLIDQGLVDPAAGLKRTHIHLIHAEAEMSRLDASSKFNTEPAFLDHLFRMGRRAAEGWLDATFDRIGVESTIDIEETYL